MTQDDLRARVSVDEPVNQREISVWEIFIFRAHCAFLCSFRAWILDFFVAADIVYSRNNCSKKTSERIEGSGGSPHGLPGGLLVQASAVPADSGESHSRCISEISS